ncbi:recombinase family protein [Gordonia shandongensis]|uniref:recombinase family protein n=1 Tax=Gordonia shandongensis TaxID=376351 RepID=UPI00047EE2B4|nr:recombinase family protein [Gordonia shandongensis]
MRAIIYCRVSSDPAKRGKSVTEQEAECRDVCTREGWDVAEVLVDNDLGASRYSRGERTAYARLEATLRPGDVLVTWEASRAQRDLSAYLTLRDLCADRGVLWSYSGRTHDLTRGDDRFTTGLDALLAEKEVEQTRERVLRAVRARAAAGRPHGKPPYGYRVARDPDTGQSTGRAPDPEQAPRVQEIIRRILAGDSIYRICRDFTDRGIPRPRSSDTNAWDATTVRRIANNPAYAGLRVHHGQVVGPGTWEPIISVDDHERAKSLVSDPSRTTRPKTGDGPAWLLSGILACAHCGSPCVRNKTRGKPIYACAGHRYAETGLRHCTGRVIERVDPYVTEAIIRRLEGQDLVDDLCASDVEYRAAADEAAALRRRLDGFTDAAAEGEVSPSALARIEAKLLPQIEAAEQRARSRVSPLVESMRGAGARRRWDSLPMLDRRELVRALTASITLSSVGRGRKTYPDGEGITITWR